MTCKECGAPMRVFGSMFSTLVGYWSPPGHDHDDNCQKMMAACESGHKAVCVSKRRRCPACDWVGKATCFCHDGEKMDEWP